MNINTDIQDVIIETRTGLGLTIEQFALLFDVQCTTITRWEKGESNPTGRNKVYVNNLVKAFKEDREELYERLIELGIKPKRPLILDLLDKAA